MNIDGTYEIIEMSEWDKEDIDLVEPGYIRIKGNRGELHFICVDGDMDIRRMKARLGGPKAITATAHKLARLVYSMLKHGTEFTDIGQEYYEQNYKSRVIKNLKKRAQQLGYELVEAMMSNQSNITV